MATIKIRLRFYLPHDIDLISLMITHEMDVVHAIYCAVSAFVNHDSFAIKIPPLREIPMEKKRVFHGNMTLDAEKDKEIIDLLDCIEPGYRNNFLKNILRLYIYCPATEAFLTNPADMGKFEELFKVFTDGKRFADAATNKRRKKGKKPSSSVKSLSDNTEREERSHAAEVMKPSKELLPAEAVTEDKRTTEQTEEDLTDLFSSLLG